MSDRSHSPAQFFKLLSKAITVFVLARSLPGGVGNPIVWPAIADFLSELFDE